MIQTHLYLKDSVREVSTPAIAYHLKADTQQMLEGHRSSMERTTNSTTKRKPSRKSIEKKLLMRRRDPRPSSTQLKTCTWIPYRSSMVDYCVV